jgi:peroxiredoxin
MPRFGSNDMTGKVRVLRSVARLGVAGTAFALLGGQSVAPLPSPPLPADARSITGQRISVDPNSGARFVVLDFFTSWCVPCGPEARQLERVQQRLAGKGVLVVGIDVREDAGKARDFARDNHLTYPIMTDDGRMEKQYRGVGLSSGDHNRPARRDNTAIGRRTGRSGGSNRAGG